jgi:hypothetical protein
MYGGGKTKNYVAVKMAANAEAVSALRPASGTKMSLRLPDEFPFRP